MWKKVAKYSIQWDSGDYCNTHVYLIFNVTNSHICKPVLIVATFNSSLVCIESMQLPCLSS